MFLMIDHMTITWLDVFLFQYDKELEQLEHEINPLLGDDPQAALSYLCRKCVDRMKAIPNVSSCISIFLQNIP